MQKLSPEDSDIATVPASASSVVRTVVIAFGALALVMNMLFMMRLDNRQERFLDYGVLVGEYKSEQTEIRETIASIQSELQIQRAWVTSVKTDLAELLAVTEDDRQRVIIAKMIAKEIGGS